MQRAAHAPGDRRMQDQRHRADHRDDAEVALWPVTVEHAAKAEERRGQRRPHHQVERVGQHLRHRQVAEVHHEAEHDADHQRIAEDRAQHAERGRAQAAAPMAHQFHRGDADGIAERRVDRDDGIVPGQRAAAIGTLGDRQAKQERIREQPAKADRHTVFPGAAKDIARAEEGDAKAGQGSGVEAQEQPGVEVLRQVKRRDRAIQQAGQREPLRELHQPVDVGIAQVALPHRDIAEAQHEEDRQDDLDEGPHVTARR